MTINDKHIHNFTLAIIAAGFLLFCGLAGYAVAQSGLQEVTFTKKDNRYLAERKAETLYKNYLKDINLEFDRDTETVSQYLPLDPSDPQRFLAYYIKGEMGDECPRLGCELMIFEHYKPNEWRKVIHVFTHKMWIGKPPDNDAPRNIYIKSFSSQPWSGPGNTRDLWEWEKDSYKFKEEVTE